VFWGRFGLWKNSTESKRGEPDKIDHRQNETSFGRENGVAMPETPGAGKAPGDKLQASIQQVVWCGCELAFEAWVFHQRYSVIFLFAAPIHGFTFNPCHKTFYLTLKTTPSRG
tara:strand:- start:557 stop:895 length:339 start_codon:yes stop_codon:yes gene_type:complete